MCFPCLGREWNLLVQLTDFQYKVLVEYSRYNSKYRRKRVYNYAITILNNYRNTLSVYISTKLLCFYIFCALKTYNMYIRHFISKRCWICTWCNSVICLNSVIVQKFHCWDTIDFSHERSKQIFLEIYRFVGSYLQLYLYSTARTVSNADWYTSLKEIHMYLYYDW